MEAIKWIQFILGAAFIVCGLVICLLELFGLYRMKYVMNRMHAAAMGDTLGISTCLLGLMICSGFNFTTLKMILIVVFLWFSSPVSSHLIARLEITTNDNLESHCKKYDDLSVLEAELQQEAENKEVEA